MNYLEYNISNDIIELFQNQAKQKIEIEGWGKQGRNVTIKQQNFVNCWTTEEAFKQILIQKKVWFRNRGLYFGDSKGAGADFEIKVNGQEISVGLRSINDDSLNKWKTVAYPDDRFREEQEKIANHHIVCHTNNGHCKFFGIISKTDLLNELETSKILYSPKNQEKFRVIPINRFSYSDLLKLIDNAEKI